MSSPPWITADDLAALVPMPAAIDALAAAFASGDGLDGPARAHHAVPDGDLLLMPAASAAGIGVKLVTVTPANPARDLPLIHGVYVLFAPGTHAPAALIDGGAMTGLRTAAVSGLATRHLARADCRHLVVIGAGIQGRAHVRAMRAVRPIERVTVASRSDGPARRLVADLRASGVEATHGGPDAIETADVVCTCTTSDTPVVAGDRLPVGVHVNAVGAYRPDARELDTATMVRGRIVVEQRAAALAEAGDLCIPIANQDLTPEAIVADLAEVVAGAGVRRGDEDVTVFKSVGLAIEDLAIAAAALRARGAS
ncbi:MAG TPA: ornithine cyclodeaminase family protein [Euzebyales bacterium]|nr:ornithine cyclodeaminase family protein [Euzebyales bacterium]